MEFNQDYVSSLNSKKRKRLKSTTYPNVPSSITKVLDKVTESLIQHDSTLTKAHIAKQCTENARKFFGL